MQGIHRTLRKLETCLDEKEASRENDGFKCEEDKRWRGLVPTLIVQSYGYTGQWDEDTLG